MIKVALLLLALLVMGNVSLQTATPGPVEVGATIQTFGQYAVLVYLIIRADRRADDQVKAWREERKYLIDLLVSRKSDEAA